MSRTLSKLLGAEEPSFSLAVNAMEKITGHQGIDVRLQTEVATGVSRVVGVLGLDVNDTHGPELYHALQDKICDINKSVIGSNGDLGSTTKVDCWVLKNVYIKSLLKHIPPRLTMKKLGFRSVDSMLKREDLAVVVAMALLCEARSWTAEYDRGIKKAKQTDFEARSIRFLEASGAPNNCIVSSVPEMGCVVSWQGKSLYSRALAEDAANQIRIQGAHVKLYREFFPDPRALVVAHVGGMAVEWRVVYKLFARNNLPESLGILLSSEDFSIVNLLDDVWPEARYLGNEVSLNILDITRGIDEMREYDNRITDQFRQELTDELLVRYLSEAPLFSQLMAQIEAKL